MSFLLLLCLLVGVGCDFSPHFNRFLSGMFGPPGQMLLERLDFMTEGSFGGKDNDSTPITNRPVLIVHGVTNMASKFEFVRQNLFSKGYTNAEVYSTTYGDGDRKFILFVKLECQFVRQVRSMLRAVYIYTGKKVDVLAFSMGSPIARKAILGGECEGDYIGPPITQMVETFVSIAGANYGSSMCIVPFWVCSMRNGLHCKSKFLKELNSQRMRFEGSRSFAIYSDKDDKYTLNLFHVGVDCCGTKCSTLANSNKEFDVNGHDHDQVMVASMDLQYRLISNQTGV